MNWPWSKPKDELAPCTSVEEAEANAKRVPKDNKDHAGVARSGSTRPVAVSKK
jgi:hypothetical protein